MEPGFAGTPFRLSPGRVRAPTPSPVTSGREVSLSEEGLPPPTPTCRSRPRSAARCRSRRLPAGRLPCVCTYPLGDRRGSRTRPSRWTQTRLAFSLLGDYFVSCLCQRETGPTWRRGLFRTVRDSDSHGLARDLNGPTGLQASYITSAEVIATASGSHPSRRWTHDGG